MSMTPGSRLQDGIYVGPERSGFCYRLLLLNIKAGTSLLDAGNALAAVWAMLQRLRAGHVADLTPGQTAEEIKLVCDGALTCLLGFGASLFDRYPKLTRPLDVVAMNDAPFPSLPRVPPADRRTGEADLALQLIANTNVAVDRALVDVWMLIRQKSLPLEVVTFYSGFNRDDKRSWLGFFDGISNIDPSERVLALEATATETPWMQGGTYMGFLRLAIDLETWRTLSRAEQESIVGRDKLTGCPLESIASGPSPMPVGGCPIGRNAPGSGGYENPPPPPQDELRVSHIHRANPNRQGPQDDRNNRIFRQGYEFVEPVADGRLRLGINFVSFQRTLGHLTRILNVPSWLGNANFGGRRDAEPGEPRYVTVVSLIAGGYYAVPPKSQPFPGAEIF